VDNEEVDCVPSNVLTQTDQTVVFDKNGY